MQLTFAAGHHIGKLTDHEKANYQNATNSTSRGRGSRSWGTRNTPNSASHEAEIPLSRGVLKSPSRGPYETPSRGKYRLIDILRCYNFAQKV
jgi:hypothetical protein